MTAAVRYHISTSPPNQSNSSPTDARIIQSGKLSSASTTALSTIITVPPSPDGKVLTLSVASVFTDPVAKTGGNAAFLLVTEPGVDPVPGGAEVAIDNVPRLVLRAAGAAFGAGEYGFTYIVRPGQRFAIQDTGWAS